MVARYYLYLWFFGLILSFDGMLAKEKRENDILSIGAVFDLTSHVGRQQKVAVEIAMESFYFGVSNRPRLHIKDSKGEPVLAFQSGKK